MIVELISQRPFIDFYVVFSQHNFYITVHTLLFPEISRHPPHNQILFEKNDGRK